MEPDREWKYLISFGVLVGRYPPTVRKVAAGRNTTFAISDTAPIPSPTGRCTANSVGRGYPPSFAALSASYHQVSGMPRA